MRALIYLVLILIAVVAFGPFGLLIVIPLALVWVGARMSGAFGAVMRELVKWAAWAGQELINGVRALSARRSPTLSQAAVLAATAIVLLWVLIPRPPGRPSSSRRRSHKANRAQF